MGRGAAGEVRCGILRLRGALTGLRDTGVCAGAGSPGRRGKASLKSPRPEPPALLPRFSEQPEIRTTSPPRATAWNCVKSSKFALEEVLTEDVAPERTPGAAPLASPSPPSSWPRCPRRCLSPPVSAPAGPAALSTRVEPTWPGLLGTRLPRALSRGVLLEHPPPRASP